MSRTKVAHPTASDLLFFAVRTWLPVILWMVAIFWGSSRSTLPGPLGSRSAWGEVSRSATHMGEYAILAALTYRALRKTSAAARRSSFLTSHFSLLISILFPLLFALTDEWHQSFVPGRQFDLRDLALDLVGVVAALSIQKTGIRIKNRGLSTKD